MTHLKAALNINKPKPPVTAPEPVEALDSSEASAEADDASGHEAQLDGHVERDTARPSGAPEDQGDSDGGRPEARDLLGSLLDRALDRISQRHAEFERLTAEGTPPETAERPSADVEEPTGRQSPPETLTGDGPLPYESPVATDDTRGEAPSASSPGQPIEPDESSQSREELQRLVGEPISSGPLPGVQEDEADAADWHNAFQRLAAERGVPDAPHDHQPATADAGGTGQGTSENLDEAGVGRPEPQKAPDGSADKPLESTPLPQAVSEELAERRLEFQQLVQQADPVGPLELSTPPQEGSEDPAKRRGEFHHPRQQAGGDKPSEPTPPPQPDSDDAAKRRQEFQLLRQQAGVDRPPEPAPPPQPDSDDVASRREEFQQLRQQAGVDKPPEPTPPPQADSDDVAKRRQEFQQLRQQAGIDKPSEPTPPPQADSNDSVNTRQEFQQLRQQAGVEKPLEPAPPPQADSDDAAATRRQEFQQLRQQAGVDKPLEPAPPPQADSDDAAATGRQEFQQLRQQAGVDKPLEPAPPPQADSDDAAATRRQEFQQLRQQAGVDKPTEPPAPPQADSDDAVNRHQEFQQLRQQAGVDKPPEPTPPPQASSGDAVSRRQEFQQLRQRIEALSDVGVPTGAVTWSDTAKRRDEHLLDKPAISEQPAPVTQSGASGQAPAPGLPAEGGASLGVQEYRSEVGWDKVATEVEPLGRHEAGTGGPASWTDWRFALDHALSLLRGAFRRVKPLLSQGRGARSMANHGLTTIRGITTARTKEVTSLSIEHGSVKLLVTRGMEVVDHRIIPSNPSLFREGMVSDSVRMAGLLQKGLAETEGQHRRITGAVPGYQTTLRRIELPNAKSMDPEVVIPSEAKRNLGISLENSRLAWHRLPGTSETAHWLVLSATNRSISSLTATAQSAGLKLKAMELRPFALARAINQPDAVCAWTAADGCDAVVVRDWVPVTHHAAYWGTGPMVDANDLVNRITEVIESTVVSHDMHNPEISVPVDLPLYVTGSPVGQEPDIAQRVAANLRRPLAQPEPPLILPPDFPVDDLIINIGLALWEG